MLTTFCLENECLLIRPIGPEDLTHYEDRVKEIYQLLSDDDTLRFIPQKRLRTITEAKDWLTTSILNFHCGQNYTYFIADKQTKKLLGILEIIPPGTAQQHYQLADYPYFIEFYLLPEVRRKGFMTGAVALMLGELARLNISNVAAVINKDNLAARKVLQNTGFFNFSKFDHRQDLYLKVMDRDLLNVRKAG